jgi:hypothetical protein
MTVHSHNDKRMEKFPLLLSFAGSENVFISLRKEKSKIFLGEKRKSFLQRLFGRCSVIEFDLFFALKL